VYASFYFKIELYLIEELNIKAIAEFIEDWRNAWKSHVLRMPLSRLSPYILSYGAKG
jgi:hypothetical protein